MSDATTCPLCGLGDSDEIHGLGDPVREPWRDEETGHCRGCGGAVISRVVDTDSPIVKVTGFVDLDTPLPPPGYTLVCPLCDENVVTHRKPGSQTDCPWCGFSGHVPREAVAVDEGEPA